MKNRFVLFCFVLIVPIFLFAVGFDLKIAVAADSPKPESKVPAEKKVQPSPKYERLPLGSIKARGWIREQLLRSKAGMGGHLDELEPEMIGRPFVDRSHKSPVIPGWSGEISGTYWTGLVQLAFTLDDRELIAKADRWVHGTLALQEADGYLGSYRPTENRMEDYSAWSSNWAYRALLSWYEATGETKVLDSVHRGLLWFVKNWSGDKKTSYAAPTIIESMIDVWRKTGDQRLADWSVEYLSWLDGHDTFRHGKASLLRPELFFNEDHVVAFGENLKHPALVWLYTGRPDDLAASENGVQQVRSKSWLCNGSPSTNGEHFSPPSSIHETEYCNFTTWQNSFLRLLALTGKSEYGDYTERIFFNGAQGARKKDERAIVYNSKPNQFNATLRSDTFQAAEFGVYAPNFRVACCPAQSVRLVPEYVRSMLLRDADGNIAFSVYGPCETVLSEKDGRKITLTEVTNYPFDENISITFKTNGPWQKSIRVRIPDWCKNWQIKRNGSPVKATAVNGWVTLTGPWNDSDRLNLFFGMEPQIVPTEDVYFPTEPLRAVEYGPLLFSIKYNVRWTPVQGRPLTPLPKDWSWFDATCEGMPGFFAFTPEALDGSAKIKVVKVEKKNADSYVWDDPPLKLAVPVIRTQKHAWPFGMNNLHVTPLPYGNPVTPDEGAVQEYFEFVPYGCTNLRLTCLPIVKSEAKSNESQNKKRNR